MPVSAADVSLIRDSFERLRADLDTHSAFFYEALFRHAPELRGMFRDDLTGQGMKFMTTLDEIITHLLAPDEMAERFSELGRQHASLGVVAGHFEPMGEALIDTLRAALGARFGPDLEAAWRQAYAEMTATMMREGRIS